MIELISIRQAAAMGIDRLRKPVWVTPEDHLKIDVYKGELGPWCHLYTPFNLECNGRDPVDILCIQMDYDAMEWLPYDGPGSDSEAYKAAQDKYAGCMK